MRGYMFEISNDVCENKGFYYQTLTMTTTSLNPRMNKIDLCGWFNVPGRGSFDIKIVL